MKRLIFSATLGALVASPLAAGEHDYVVKMINCDEQHERYVSDAYNCQLTLLAGKILEKGVLKLPSQMTQKEGAYYIFNRAFYVSPNELKGFEFCIPSELMTEKNGILENNTALRLMKESMKQGIELLELGRK